MKQKKLNKDEKEIFKAIKKIKHGYTLQDFLKTRSKAKKQMCIKKEKQ